MACADVATAKVKTSAINLIILSSYAHPQEEHFLKDADLVRRLAFGERLGSQDERYTCSYEPRTTKRKWVDVPSFSGANPRSTRSTLLGRAAGAPLGGGPRQRLVMVLIPIMAAAPRSDVAL